jgi:hypothetical protein
MPFSLDADAPAPALLLLFDAAVDVTKGPCRALRDLVCWLQSGLDFLMAIPAICRN